MSKHPELFRRHDGNPILSAADWHYPVNSVFNPGATLLPDGTVLVAGGYGSSRLASVELYNCAPAMGL
jgi:predicted GH43/DUF377 family glycosyl hydrolase